MRLKAGGLKGAIVAVLEAEAAYDVTMSESAKTERVAHAEASATTRARTRTPNPNPNPEPEPEP